MFIPRLVESDEMLQDDDAESVFDKEFHDLVVKEFKQQREAMPDAGVLEIPKDFVFPETFTAWRQYCMTHEPSMELVSNMDHSLTIKLLMYCARWLAPKTPKQISQWIYAILCRVSDVLEASDVSVLRDLGKRAKTLDLREELEETTRFTCKLVIHVVAGGFGQRDLL
jgi:survival of motor neuron protein-interacting protein 1